MELRCEGCTNTTCATCRVGFAEKVRVLSAEDGATARYLATAAGVSVERLFPCVVLRRAGYARVFLWASRCVLSFLRPHSFLAVDCLVRDRCTSKEREKMDG